MDHFLQSNTYSLYTVCLTLILSPFTAHFHECNSEITTGRAMKLHTKVQECPIEWVHFSPHHYVLLFLGKIMEALLFSTHSHKALWHKWIHITGILLQGLSLRYKFLMTNGPPGDYWHEHFSADEFCEWIVYTAHGIYKLYVALFLL